jgi:diacylglycerol kinase family enzyme
LIFSEEYSLKNYVVLYNPLANNGRAEEAARKLENILTDGEIRYVDIAALGSFYDFFISCDDDCIVILTGGDGTLHHFVNDTRGLKIKQKIYYYGAGSGNDFLNDLGKDRGAEPFSIEEYIEDLPIVRVNGKEYRFVNNVGYGIDGYACEKGDEIRANTNKPINYTTIAIKGLLYDFTPRNATVTVDGVTKEYKKVWLAPAMNGRYFGGGMKIAPEQDRLDPEGKLSFAIAHDLSRARIIPIFPEIFKGTHVRHTKYIELVKCDEVTVKFDSPCALQIDGETILGVTEYTAYSRNAVKARKA